MTFRHIFLFTCLIVVGLASGVQGLTQANNELTEEFHQSYTISPNGRIRLENMNGAVHVNAWDRNEVKVDAIKHAFKQERLDEAKIEVTAASDSVQIKTRYPEGSYYNSSDRHLRENNPASVEYTLTVPRNVRIDSIELINGEVDINSVTGDIKATSINGRVLGVGLGGNVRLSTINGEAVGRFSDLTNVQQISIGSVNGSVELEVPSDVNARIKASTVHGPISSDFNIPVHKGEYVGRDASATLGTGGILIKLDNVNGSIRIRHAADNRPLSNVTSEVRGNSNDEIDATIDSESAARISREVSAEVRAATASIDEAEIKEATKEATKAARDARKIQRDSVKMSQDIQRQTRELTRSVVVAYGNADSYRLVERDSKTFTVSGVPDLAVETFDGTLSVRSWDKNEISVTITKRASDEETLKGLSIDSSQSGNSIKVSAKMAEHPRGAKGDSGGVVNLEIYVPKNANLTLGSGDGKVDVDGVSGSVTAKTGDGSIWISDSTGRLNATTGDGSVRVQGFNGDATVRTGDGRIVLQGAFNQLTAQTGDGPISLELPQNANATVEARGETVSNESGGIEETNPDSHIRRFKIGSGGNLLKLQSNEGRITIRRSN